MTSEGLHGVVAAAHELKTPLALISYMAAALGDSSLDLTDAERQQLAERIRLSADRSLRLVQGLTLARRFDDMNQLALQFKLEPLNVGHLCQEALHELEPLARAHRRSLRIRTERQPRLAVANPELLKSVCYNLVDNAIRHTGEGSEIEIAVSKRGNFVRLGICDTGPAPGRRDLARLKERLGVRVQPLSGRPGSSGLGLYIASRMAQAMGGRLGVARHRTGTEFYAALVHSRQLRLL